MRWKRLIEVFAFCSDSMTYTKVPNTRSSRRYCSVEKVGSGLGQEFVELGLGGVDDLGRLHAAIGSGASGSDSRWRKSLTRA